MSGILGCVCFDVKYFSGVKYFQVKIFSGNENIFKCLVAFEKCFEKYFLVFGCIFENIIKNTFSTCCSHFLTFSQLPNKYIILFLIDKHKRSKTQQNQFIKFGQIERRRKRERGDWVRSRGEIARQRRRRDCAAEATGFNLEAWLHGGGECEIALWRWLGSI